MRNILFLSLLGFLSACTATHNDPNFGFTAAFGVSPDSEVTVYRGKLWESRHLLVFSEYYALAEFSASDQKVAALMGGTKKKFQPFDGTNFGFSEKPDERWFAPKDGSNYVGWSSDEGMYVVRSSRTGHVFVWRSEL